MKKKVHPNYQKILFVDSTTGHRFLIGSTLQPTETEKFEGKEYPVYQLATSAYSHPFFTGSKQLVDAEGRVDKFKKRYTAAQQKTNTPSSPAAPAEKPAKVSKSKK